MNREPSSPLSLAQVLVCAAVLVLLAGIVLMAGTVPTYLRARDRHRLAGCISNMGRIYQAIKMYEADHDEVPVQYGPRGTAQWTVMLAPYVHDRRIFLCEADETHGEVYRWGAPNSCSYCYMYTMPNLMKGSVPGAYRQPKAWSPLLMCRAHEKYQAVLYRYDGSLELAPPFRYRVIQVQLK